MNKILIVALFCLLTSGCASLNEYRNEKLIQISNYMNNPNNDMMVVVDSANPNSSLELKIQCHTMSGSLSEAGTNSASFETYTPHVVILPTGEAVNKLRGTYANLSKREKKEFALQYSAMAPTVSMTCQCQDAFGIQGKIYFNGKEVSSDTANVSYGVVNLSYTLPLEEITK